MKMNRLAVIALTSLLLFGAGAPVFAAGDRDHDRGRNGWDDRGRGNNSGNHGRNNDRRDWRDDRRNYNGGNRGNYNRGNYNNGYREGYRDARSSNRYYAPPPRYVAPPRVVYRPYGFQRGYRYSNYYGGPVYVVNDYNRYQLRQPPYGHRWIRDDRGNMLMVAIATGIIADLVLRN